MTEEVSRKPTAAVRDFNRRAAMGAGLAAAVALLAGAATNDASAEPLKKAGTTYKKTGTKYVKKTGTTYTKKAGTKYVQKAGTKYQKGLPKNDKNIPR